MALVAKFMFKTSKSRFSFDETVERVQAKALEVGWHVPNVFALQSYYAEQGFTDIVKTAVVYLCDPSSGCEIMQDDADKPMSVLMPTGVSIYETKNGETMIARMNMGMMAKMIGGRVSRVFARGGANLEKALAEIIEGK